MEQQFIWPLQATTSVHRFVESLDGYTPAVVSRETGQTFSSRLEVGHVGKSEGSIGTVGGICGSLKKTVKILIF